MIRAIVLARSNRQYGDSIGIRVAFIDGNGEKSVLMVAESVSGGPTVHLTSVEEAAGRDSLELRANDLGFNGDAQVLMDQLWDAGIRPTQAKGSAGQLAAVNEHLTDMRQAFWEQHKVLLDLAKKPQPESLEEVRERVRAIWSEGKRK